MRRIMHWIHKIALVGLITASVTYAWRGDFVRATYLVWLAGIIELDDLFAGPKA